MASSAHHLGLQLQGLALDTHELNDYESSECDDNESAFGDFESEQSHESDVDSVELQDELAHAMFGGAVASNSSHTRSLDDEKLLDVLQRRLFPDKSLDASSLYPERGARPGIASKNSSSTSNHLRARSAPQMSPQMFSLLNGGARGAPPSISPDKVRKMVNRFRLQEEKRARKLRAKREEAESKEQSRCTHAPVLSQRSRKLTNQAPAFLERQRKHLLLRKQHEDAARQRHDENRARVLEAHVKTPCICSRGNTATSSERAIELAGAHAAASEAAGHTQSCLRFMAMCRTMNASFAIQRRKDEMTRSVDAMLAFHEEKKRKQQARSDVARAHEAAQTPFAPQLNARSEQIYAEMVRSGRLQSELTVRLRAPRQTPPVVPASTFRPAISKRSKALVLRQKQRASTSADDAADTSDIFTRLHTQQLARSSSAEPPSCSVSSPRRTGAAVAWHEIAYRDSAHRFILESFGLSVAGGSGGGA